jgi:hypothetical protein
MPEDDSGKQINGTAKLVFSAPLAANVKGANRMPSSHSIKLVE